ncbi:metallophosphoesterase [Roseisolibacter sp. H3M3-2]|uniref:metallophosphoesterase n=1 Tax=Roseisolibacter sp. H3M3-2 TaxID=3031323 RepID=UPI0023D98AF6|nr:metallophosphoesterase [Roseisolibacter sp. H3M3-2]MDF1501332.1 metallophosphoesterase [Roseisolibacter sp. H3M3-2]
MTYAGDPPRATRAAPPAAGAAGSFRAGVLARYTKRAAAVLGAAGAGLLLWGALVEPRLIDTEHEVAPIPGLPSAWEGRRIALIADLQVGMWGANTGTARRIVARLAADRPAAVLIAGDFLYKAGDDLAEHVAQAVAIVRPLPAAGIPTYAVLGNHDYGMDEQDDRRESAMAERLRRALEQAGVRVLRNEAVPLEAPGAPEAGAGALYLVGVGSHWAGEDDPAAALAQVPRGASSVVLMHNPASFTRLSAGAAPVALAAHTHGGQIRLPFTPDWSWLTFVKEDAVHADGWSDATFGAAGNRLYVNRGIGFSDVPIRINCPPELTLLTLRRAAR